MKGATDAWLDGELAGCSLADERLNKRLRKLLAQIGSDMGQSIPLVCQDWANAKAAYRFLSNERVSEADILAGHFQSTRDRTAATDGPVLVLHDTTEFSYQREKSEAIGITKAINSGRDKAGRLRSHTVCGILMHSSLAVTTEWLPLGLTAVKNLDAKEVQGHRRSQEEDQSDTCSHREEGERPMVGQSDAIDGTAERSRTIRPYW